MRKGDLVALTGGTGFVGSHVAHALLAAGYRVRALARRPEDPGWLKGTGAELVKGDVRDAATLPALVEDAAAGSRRPDGAPVPAAAPPRPVSSYGRSKLAGEEAVRNEPGLAFTILRPRE